MVAVRAIENFMNDAELDVTLVTSAIESESEYYSGHDVDDIKVKTLKRPTSTCTGSGTVDK